MYTFEIKKRDFDGVVKWLKATEGWGEFGELYTVKTKEEVKNDIKILKKLYPNMETRIIEF